MQTAKSGAQSGWFAIHDSTVGKESSPPSTRTSPRALLASGNPRMPWRDVAPVRTPMKLKTLHRRHTATTTNRARTIQAGGDATAGHEGGHGIRDCMSIGPRNSRNEFKKITSCGLPKPMEARGSAHCVAAERGRESIRTSDRRFKIGADDGRSQGQHSSEACNGTQREPNAAAAQIGAVRGRVPRPQ